VLVTEGLLTVRLYNCCNVTDTRRISCTS